MRSPRHVADARRVLLAVWLLPFAAFTAFASPLLRVEGKVVDDAGRPIRGARVSFQGAAPSSSVRTGPDGSFRLEAEEGMTPTLVVEAEGYGRWERNVAVSASSPSLRISLTPTAYSDSVVVSASRAPTRLKDTASSIVLLTGEDLQTSAAPTTDVALREVPGFTLFRRTDSRTANPTAQGVSLRGVGGSGASRAVVLDDGVPLNDPFGGWIEWGRVPRAAIERAEVLRGGASDLYGASALAGAVALFRREPTSSGAWAEASLGSWSQQEASALLSGSQGTWSARLGGDFFDTDGYVAVAPSDRGPIDTSITSRHGTGDLTLEHVEEGSPRLFVRGNYFDESRENGTPLQTNDTRMSQVSAGADVPKVFDGDLSVRVYGISERYHQVFSAVSGDRASERLTDLQTVPSGSFGLRTQWHRIWGTQRLVAGLEGAEVRGSSDEILGATGASFSNAGGHQRTGALFVNDSIPLGSRWILSAAARLDLWRNFDATLTKGATGSPGTVTELADRSNTAFSPRGSVLFRIDSNLSATASGYRSFRAPTLNELYRSFQLGNTLTLSNPDLAAEHLTGADAGLIWTAAGGGLLARGTFFWNEIDNAITSVTLSSTPTAITRQRQNLGQTRSQGVEVDAQAALTQDLSVSAGYLYADATVVSAADPALVGLRVPQVPRHQGSVRVSYQIGPVFLWAQGRWIGNQFEDDQNLLPLGSASIADVLLSGRVLRGIEVFGACENVFDAQYSVARTPVRSLGQPRTLRFGVRAVLF